MMAANYANILGMHVQYGTMIAFLFGALAGFIIHKRV